MNIDCFTPEEYINVIEPLGNTKEFLYRIAKHDYKTNWIVTWNDWSNETDQQITSWVMNNKKYMSGGVTKSWPCQIEFEYEEDVVAFKLVWS